jgi:hypothetical protein
MAPLGLSPRPLTTHLRNQNEDRKPDEADRGGRTTALVRVRGCSQCPGRLHPVDFVPACILTSAQDRLSPASSSGQGAGYVVTGDGHLRTFCYGAHEGSQRYADHRACRRQRDQTTGAAWRSNKRGGSAARKAVAVPRREMHTGRPALPGRPDEAVWHSSVQGEER